MAQGYYLSPDLARRLQRAVEWVEQQGARLGGYRRLSVGPRADIMAEITGYASSTDNYTWKEKRLSAAGIWEDLPNGLTSTDVGKAIEQTGVAGWPDGSIVRLTWRPGATGPGFWCFRTGAPRGVLFLVFVTKDAGSAGSKTTPCSWTYTVTDYGGRTLGTGLTPAKPRTSVGKYAQPGAGSPGLGWYNSVGDFKLYEAAEEIPIVSVCP